MMTLTLSEAAFMLRRRPSTLARTWRRLHQEHGFPMPIPGLGLAWSRVQLELWINARHSANVTPANDSERVDLPDLVAKQRQYLSSIYVKGQNS